MQEGDVAPAVGRVVRRAPPPVALGRERRLGPPALHLADDRKLLLDDRVDPGQLLRRLPEELALAPPHVVEVGNRRLDVPRRHPELACRLARLGELVALSRDRPPKLLALGFQGEDVAVDVLQDRELPPHLLQEADQGDLLAERQQSISTAPILASTNRRGGRPRCRSRSLSVRSMSVSRPSPSPAPRAPRTTPPSASSSPPTSRAARRGASSRPARPSARGRRSASTSTRSTPRSPASSRRCGSATAT